MRLELRHLDTVDGRFRLSYLVDFCFRHLADPKQADAFGSLRE